MKGLNFDDFLQEKGLGDLVDTEQDAGYRNAKKTENKEKVVAQNNDQQDTKTGVQEDDSNLDTANTINKSSIENNLDEGLLKALNLDNNPTDEPKDIEESETEQKIDNSNNIANTVQQEQIIQSTNTRKAEELTVEKSNFDKQLDEIRNRINMLKNNTFQQDITKINNEIQENKKKDIQKQNEIQIDDELGNFLTNKRNKENIQNITNNSQITEHIDSIQQERTVNTNQSIQQDNIQLDKIHSTSEKENDLKKLLEASDNTEKEEKSAAQKSVNIFDAFDDESDREREQREREEKRQEKKRKEKEPKAEKARKAAEAKAKKIEEEKRIAEEKAKKTAEEKAKKLKEEKARKLAEEEAKKKKEAEKQAEKERKEAERLKEEAEKNSKKENKKDSQEKDSQSNKAKKEDKKDEVIGDQSKDEEKEDKKQENSEKQDNVAEEKQDVNDNTNKDITGQKEENTDSKTENQQEVEEETKEETTQDNKKSDDDTIIDKHFVDVDKIKDTVIEGNIKKVEMSDIQNAVVLDEMEKQNDEYMTIYYLLNDNTNNPEFLDDDVLAISKKEEEMKAKKLKKEEEFNFKLEELVDTDRVKVDLTGLLDDTPTKNK